MDVIGVVNVVAGVLGFVAIGGLVWIALHGDPARAAEDEARAYFDRHGRWPDDRQGTDATARARSRAFRRPRRRRT